MTQVCRPAKCVVAGRIALLDQCTAAPVAGAMNGYAFGCIIEPNWTPELEDAEESQVTDNCQNVCLYDPGCAKKKRTNIEFKIKEPDMEFLALIHGDPLIVDDGVTIGVRERVRECSPFLFLEFFEDTGDCDTEGESIVIRHLFPKVRLRHTSNEREGVFRVLQIEGMTFEVPTTSIGDGPFNDIDAGLFSGAPASERTDHEWYFDDFVPTIQCGAIAVPAELP